MGKDKRQATETAELHSRAEELLRTKTAEARPPHTEAESQRLLHELQVHQIELEMQNTELRQALDEAETAFEKYAELYDFAPVGYFTLDRKGIIFAANLTGASLMGIERAQLIGRRFGLFVAAEARPSFAAFLGKVFTSSTKETCEVALLKEGNSPLFVQVEAVAAASGQDCRIGLIDITERKLAEDESRKDKALLRCLIDSVGDLIFIKDVNGVYQACNKAGDEFIGLPECEQIGKTDFDFFGRKVGEVIRECDRQILASGKERRFEEWITYRDGRRRLLDTVKAPFRGPDGKQLGLVGIARDITKRKWMEEALRESEQRVKRKLERILDPEGDIGDLDLADIIDTDEIQAFMDDLYRLTGLKMSIIDLKGRVLVDVGWQDICSKFHRAHPETLKNCLESDTDLTVGVPPGEFRTYRCRNNMWHIVTPIIVGGRHMGNLFMGQFFFEDEQLDYELFRSQAVQYGFNEANYMAALAAVPRLSKEYVETGMAYFKKLADRISRLSYSNIKLARSLAERDALLDSLRKSQQQNEFLANIVMHAGQPFGQAYPDGWLGLINNAFEQLTGYTYDELMSINWANTLTPPEWQVFEIEKLEELHRTGKPVRYEKEYTRKDGTRVPIELLVHIVTDSEGNPQYYYSFITDITARKQAEEALMKLNEELENRVAERTAQLREKDHMLLLQSRQAAMGEMLSNIAHQWRQPLNVVGLTVQELLQIYDLGKFTREFLDKRVSSAMKIIMYMSRTIDDFRNYFTPDKEKVEFKVDEAIANTLSLIEDSFKNQHIGIEVVPRMILPSTGIGMNSCRPSSTS
jgi:PAS domain S-box-containing protein